MWMSDNTTTKSAYFGESVTVNPQFAPTQTTCVASPANAQAFNAQAVQVSFVDSSVHTCSAGIPNTVWAALLSYGGQDYVPLDQID
jgi:hypothetical protein